MRKRDFDRRTALEGGRQHPAAGPRRSRGAGKATSGRSRRRRCPSAGSSGAARGAAGVPVPGAGCPRRPSCGTDASLQDLMKKKKNPSPKQLLHRLSWKSSTHTSLFSPWDFVPCEFRGDLGQIHHLGGLGEGTWYLSAVPAG